MRRSLQVIVSAAIAVPALVGVATPASASTATPAPGPVDPIVQLVQTVAGDVCLILGNIVTC